MGCSSPNGIVVFHTRKVKFLGPIASEEDPRYFYQRRQFADIHDVPCGKCDLCLVTRRYERALRIMLEVESFPESSFFFTLTYSNEFQDSNELDHSHWSQFVKDFRQNFCQAKYCKWPDKRKRGKVRSLTFKSIKQVMCGEYGGENGRRHFHGIIFGHEFSDLVFTGNYSDKGFPIYTSESLAQTWKKGFVQIERVNMDLALYVSKYVTDRGLDGQPDVGHVKKQYGRFGRGIGRTWLNKYWRDVLNAGQLMLQSGNYPIPRSFLKWLEGNRDFERWKVSRALTTRKQVHDSLLQGDGPLRRAQAKGRIFKHIHTKKRLDNATTA